MAPNDYTTKIQSIREGAVLGENGKSEAKIIVTFSVGAHGPFTLNFPKDGFDPIKARADVTAFAEKLKQLAY